LGGIKEGDFIVEISGVDAKWFGQKQVLDLLKAAGNNLDLKVITPMDSKSHSNSKVLISNLTQNSSFSNSYFHRSNRHTLVLTPHYPTRAPLESVLGKVLQCRPQQNLWQENLEN
jgi:hypothetical protein